MCYMQYIFFRALFTKRFPIYFMKPHPWGFFVRSGYVMVFEVGQKHTPYPVLKGSQGPYPLAQRVALVMPFAEKAKAPPRVDSCRTWQEPHGEPLHIKLLPFFSR